MPRGYVRAMMLIIANSLAKGFSGVSVVERLVDFFNHDIVPEVPSKGSVGSRRFDPIVTYSTGDHW